MDIIDSYTDGTGQRRVVSAAVRAALREAVGVEPGADAPPDDGRVVVVRQGDVVDLAAPGELVLEDGTSRAVTKSLPNDLPLGYHVLHGAGAGGPTPVIVCPGRCFFDQSLYDWGWAVQLYAVRSQQSWGIGDLADLRQLARWSRGLGAGLLLLGPLDAVAPVLPQQASPYYPTSRRFLNPIYLCIEAIPGAEFRELPLQRLQTEARQLNGDRRIDRDAVFPRKLAALQHIWSSGIDQQGLAAFCRERGESLTQFAVYCVLAEEFGGDWRGWPESFRTATSDAVRRFAEERQQRVRFHQWLQWLLDEQLKQAATELSLVRDLPIGFDPGGFDAWIWQDLLAANVGIGAPADGFNPLGQDWGLPPFVPDRLRAAGYEPFIQTLRGSFRQAAGLRIDHVMGLFRQFWIPSGFPPTEGAYVTFPAEDLLAILALESHRAGAWVVGEDLGTAPEGMRERLAEQRVLSYRLLWFERDRPARYPAHSVAAVTTHDLPTVAGLWSGADVAELAAIGLDPANTGLEEMRRRFGELAELAADVPNEQAIQSAYRLLGESPSAVLLATLEDALAVEQRPNLPGTLDERPNWSLALPETIEAMAGGRLPREIAAALSRPAEA